METRFVNAEIGSFDAPAPILEDEQNRHVVQLLRRVVPSERGGSVTPTRLVQMQINTATC
jgi:hypothetical protein